MTTELSIPFVALNAANVIASSADKSRPSLEGVYVQPVEIDGKKGTCLTATNGHMMWDHYLNTAQIHEMVFVPKDVINTVNGLRPNKHTIVTIRFDEERGEIVEDQERGIPQISWKIYTKKDPGFDQVRKGFTEAEKEEFNRAGLGVNMVLMDIIVKAAKKLPKRYDMIKTIWTIPPKVDAPFKIQFDDVHVLIMPIRIGGEKEAYENNKKAYEESQQSEAAD